MRELAIERGAAVPVSWREPPAPLLPLRVRGLRYEAGGRALVAIDELAITPDGITVVMGPNGAGKSLLLRLLHGLVEPHRGEILWGGAPLDAAGRRRQAMVFQKPVLLRRSVAANVDFVLRSRKAGDARRRDTLLAHVGLSERAGQPARLLSGGEQQRLALARALALTPEILFLDEPTASLDPASVGRIEAIVQNACEDGTKIVFVTHDAGQARRLGGEVVFLDCGRVAEQGPTGRFLAAPRSRAAQDYLAGRLTF